MDRKSHIKKARFGLKIAQAFLVVLFSTGLVFCGAKIAVSVGSNWTMEKGGAAGPIPEVAPENGITPAVAGDSTEAQGDGELALIETRLAGLKAQVEALVAQFSDSRTGKVQISITQAGNQVPSDDIYHKQLEERLNKIIRQLDSDRDNYSLGLDFEMPENVSVETLEAGSGTFSVDENGNAEVNDADVSGNFTVRGDFTLISGDPADGKVLVSDENGTASWQVLSGVGATDHTELLNLDYGSSGHTGFEPTLTKGNLTTTTTGLSITGGVGAIIGGGAAINAAAGYGIPTTGQISNWNTAYGWGNHAGAGYLTSFAETDPVFGAWDKSTGISIAESQISDLGSYLENETDPVFGIWDKSTGISITESQISDLGNYITDLSGFDTDDLAEGASNLYFPGFSDLATDYGFTDNSANWNTAYGWGNHAGAGYFVKASDDTDDISQGSSNLFSQWDTNGSNIYYSGGSVGIGTTNPAKPLTIGSEVSQIGLRIQAASGIGRSIEFYDTDAARYNFLIGANYRSIDTFEITPSTAAGQTDYSSNTPAIFLKGSTGNLGIGNANPGSRLDVKGTLRLSGATSGYVGLAPAAAAGSTTYTLPSADGSGGQFLSTNGAGGLSWATAGGMVYPGAGIAVSTGGAWGASITDNSANWNTAYGWGNHAGAGYFVKASDDTDDISQGSSNLFSQWKDNNDDIYFDTGFVGIGTTANANWLQIGEVSDYTGNYFAMGDGDTQMALGPDGTAGAYIISDMALSLGGGGNDTDQLYLSADGKVGVGTIIPAYKLEVEGTFDVSATSTFAGNLGIRTSAPSAPLDVNGTANFVNNVFINQSNGGLWLDSYGNYNNGIFRDNDGRLLIRNNNYDLGITNTGYVGIGITAPTYPLQIRTAVGAADAFAFDDSTNYSLGGGYLSAGVGWLGGRTGTSVALWADGEETMRLDQSGNVGIGTTAPGAKLYVNGSIGINGDAGLLKIFGGAIHPTLSRNGTTGGFDFSTDAAMAAGVGYDFKNNGNSLMAITDTGNVGIGTTSPAGALHVAGSTIVLGAGEGGTPSSVTLRGPAAAGADIAGADLYFDASNGTGAGGSGKLIFRTAPDNGISGGITYDTVTYDHEHTASMSLSHTVASGDNRILVVTVGTGGEYDITNVTYGGAGLIKLADASNVAEIWYLTAPNVGTANVVVTTSSQSSYGINAGAQVFYGVDQDDPWGIPVTNTGTNDTPTVNVSSDSGELVIDVMTNGDSVYDIGAGQTPQWEAGCLETISSIEDGASTVTMSYTLSAPDNWFIAAAPLQPVPSGSATDSDILVSRMAIDANGMVGIGTTSPGYMLDIAYSGSAAGLRLQNTNPTSTGNGMTVLNDTGAMTIQIGNNNSTNETYLWNSRNSAMKFGTNNMERMRIAAGGNVGIGTTNPSYLFDVNGIINATSLYLGGSPLVQTQWTTTGSNIYYNTGNVGIGTTAPAHILDLATTGNDAAVGLSVMAAVSNTGFGVAGTAAGTNWTTPGNTAVSDNNRATYSFSTYGTPTTNLNLTNFGFAVPAGATIKGVEVTIERHVSAYATETQDHTVQLIKGGSAQGTNKATAAYWPTSDASVTYGGPVDMWGLALTPTDINASNFGITIRVKDSFGDDTARIDYLGVKIYYSEGTATNWAMGIDNSDSNKFKISGAAALGANDFLTIDNSGKIGIGTTAPATKLHVSDDTVAKIRLTSGTRLMEFDSYAADANYLWNYGADLLLGTAAGEVYNDRFYTNGIERMRIDSSGNVGIGTTAPGYKLDVEGTFDVSATSTFAGMVGIGTTMPSNMLDVHISSSSIYTSALNLKNDDNSGYGTALSIGSNNRTDAVIGATDDGIGGKLQFITHNGTFLATAMTIKNDGKIGIGTTAPDGNLHVFSTATDTLRGIDISQMNDGVQGAVLNLIKKRETSDTAEDNDYAGGIYSHFYNDNATPERVTATGIVSKILDASDGTEDADLYFEQMIGGTSTEIMRFNGGNVGIGTTAPGYKLDVVSSDGVVGRFSSSQAYSAIVLSASGAANTVNLVASDDDFVVQAGGSERFRVASDGNTTIGTLAGSGNRAVYSDSNGVLTNSSSDIRLKKNILTISDETNVIAALNKLRGIYYNWDTSIDVAKNLGGQREIGMAAQEVQGVLPELVGENASGYLSLDYPKLSAFLVEVAKNQQGQIDDLKLQLTAQGLIASTSTVDFVEDDQENGFFAALRNILGKLGLVIKDGVASLKEIVVGKARMEKMEMVDQDTGEIYCTWIASGDWVKVKGGCDEADNGAGAKDSGDAVPVFESNGEPEADNGNIEEIAEPVAEDISKNDSKSDGETAEPEAEDNLNEVIEVQTDEGAIDSAEGFGTDDGETNGEGAEAGGLSEKPIEDAQTEEGAGGVPGE